MRTAVVLALALALLAPLGLGTHGPACPGNVLVVPAGPAYVVWDDPLNNHALWLPFLYLESNGVPGLQRHDYLCETPGYGAPGAADTLVL